MTGVPSNIILPFVGIEFDSSRAQQGPAEMPFSALLIGQKLAAGSITAEVVTQVFSPEGVAELAGIGSMLHMMAIRWFKNNSNTDTYIVALDDAATATAGTRTVTFSGTATEDGEYALYFNGTRIAVSIAKDDTATTMGDTLVSAMADYDYLPYTAANASGTVTFTARNEGVVASDNDIRENLDPTEKTPAGVTVTIGSNSAGTVDPDVQDAIDAIGDQWFQVIVNPYDDATNLGLMEDFLETQFGVTLQKDGIAYQARRGTVSELTTAATASGRNSPHCVFIDATNRICSKIELATGVAAVCAKSAQEDPAKPLHRNSLLGFRPNIISERRTMAERNTLARNAVMTLTDSNGLQTEACVTMYLKNSAGAVDTAYRQQNTLFILQRARYRLVQRFLSKYPQAKLVNDTSRLKAGQQAISPGLAKAEVVNWYLEEAADGQVEGDDASVEQFIDELVIERDVNRLNITLSPDLVNQFIVGSGVMQFLQ